MQQEIKKNEELKQEEVKKMVPNEQVGIGTKESETLTEKPVNVREISVKDVTKKGSTDVVGKKVIALCKHPDKDDTISVSTIRSEINKVLKTTGAWFNKDADGLIRKNSALANLLVKYSASNVEALVGKDIETVKDEGGYLAFKAY